MPRIAHSLVAALLVTLPATVSAAPVWVGDFESGDLSQWDGSLNEEIGGVDYITVVGDVVVQGSSAGRIELHDDAVWPGNMLRRVELRHRPSRGRTDEGATVWFAWSFYLPEALSDEPGTTIGYWESAGSFQQMMAFNTHGQDIRFITQRPSFVEQWSGDGLLTPGEWHRIAMRVLWSTDEAVGEVEVWFDGEQVLAPTHTQTLADGNDHFTQLGLLRGNMDFDDVPVIYIDDVVEGDSIEDVHPALEPVGEDTGSSSSGGEGGTAADTGVDSGGTGGDGSSTTTGNADDGDGSTVSATGATGSVDSTQG
ncbi:MAG: heparin lyase I family protein, partial [Deltaproteobacteria bacterium]|nr:heparin lyase I family protein [Nannocystaceae bacterium]